MSGFETRRRVPRRKFFTSVGFLIQGKYTLVKSQQVGEGGMSVLHPEQLKIGSLIIVTFQIPHGSVACLRGEIRYLDQTTEKDYLVGVQFSNVDFGTKRELRNLVAAAESEEHI